MWFVLFHLIPMPRYMHTTMLFFPPSVCGVFFFPKNCPISMLANYLIYLDSRFNVFVRFFLHRLLFRIFSMDFLPLSLWLDANFIKMWSWRRKEKNWTKHMSTQSKRSFFLVSRFKLQHTDAQGVSMWHARSLVWANETHKLTSKSIRRI